MRENINQEIRKLLFENSENTYATFSAKLLPTIDSSSIVGVRLPVLRKIATAISKKYEYGAISSYVYSDFEFFEEKMVAGFLIGKIKDWEIASGLIEYYVTLIDNWSICDSFCSSLKIVNNHKEDMFALIERLLDLDSEFIFRFCCVMLLDYYLEEEYLDRVISLVNRRKSDGYYAKMAVAWLYCSMYCVNRELAFKCLLDERDMFIRDKTISKMIDSYLVKKVDKEYLRNLRKLQNKI